MITEVAIKVLEECRVTSKYKGYNYLIAAIEYFYIHDNERIRITKQVYPFIARKFSVNTYNVERDIRTIIEKCWENNKELLKEVTHDKLYTAPSNSYFISTLIDYYRQLYENCNT